MENDVPQSLDAWAAKVAELEPAVINGIVVAAKRLVNDKRLPQSDRDFAKAQIDAIRKGTQLAQRRPKAEEK